MPNSWINFSELQLKWSSKGEECPSIKRDGTTVFGCHDKEKGKFLLFLVGVHSPWNLFELQLKKVHPWVEEKLKFTFWPMNWTLVTLALKRRELNLNWTSLTLYSSATPIFQPYKSQKIEPCLPSLIGNYSPLHCSLWLWTKDISWLPPHP